MKISVWKTGHEIADTVAQSLAEGFDADIQHTSAWSPIGGNSEWAEHDAPIGYGILRGMSDVFRHYQSKNKPWYHCDRGYFNPGHYDGYYRISYCGTQARWHDGIPKKKWHGELEPRRSGGEYILICFPTQHVIDFFNLGTSWLNGIPLTAEFLKFMPYRVRMKGSNNSIDEDFAGAKAIITFNSSVGWEAIRRGIPCLADVNHSIIGSFYGETDLNNLIEKFHSGLDTRRELFGAMAAHDFTLGQIRKGEACSLINHYLSGSATIAGNPPPPMSANTPLSNGHNPRFQFNT